MLVFFDMADITAVPLLPQPIIPMRMAELAFEPKTIVGLKMAADEMIAVLFTNVLLFILNFNLVCRCGGRNAISGLNHISPDSYRYGSFRPWNKACRPDKPDSYRVVHGFIPFNIRDYQPGFWVRLGFKARSPSGIGNKLSLSLYPKANLVSIKPPSAA